MTNEETKKIFLILSAIYPKLSEGTPETIQTRMYVWNKTLKDYSYAEVEKAVLDYIANNPNNFTPVPGSIIEYLSKPKINGLPTIDEAWSMVRKAISAGWYHSNEEFNKLPEVIKRAVVTPNNLREWSDLKSDVISSVIASNFRKTYSDILKRVELETNSPRSYHHELIENVEIKQIEQPTRIERTMTEEELEKMIESILPAWMKR